MSLFSFQAALQNGKIPCLEVKNFSFSPVTVTVLDNFLPRLWAVFATSLKEVHLCLEIMGGRDQTQQILEWSHGSCTLAMPRSHPMHKQNVNEPP